MLYYFVKIVVNIVYSTRLIVQYWPNWIQFQSSSSVDPLIFVPMSSPPPAVDNLQNTPVVHVMKEWRCPSYRPMYLIVHNNFTESIARYWVVQGHTKSLHMQNLNCYSCDDVKVRSQFARCVYMATWYVLCDTLRVQTLTSSDNQSKIRSACDPSMYNHYNISLECPLSLSTIKL